MTRIAASIEVAVPAALCIHAIQESMTDDRLLAATARFGGARNTAASRGASLACPGRMTIPARDGDRCPECGTPLEPVELSGTPAEAEDAFVLRCANGHERRVVRHDDADAGDDTGEGTSRTRTAR